VTAYDELHKWLTKSISTPTAERLLRDYAHELAGGDPGRRNRRERRHHRFPAWHA
jgi:hypothetical protein